MKKMYIKHGFSLISIFTLIFGTNINASEVSTFACESNSIAMFDWNYILPQQIYNAINKKDASTISTFFYSTVELSLPSGAGVYSQEQAEMVLSNFFTRIENVVISIDYEKNVGDAISTICTMKSNGENYRIYILTQNKLIHQLRIEEQNE